MLTVKSFLYGIDSIQFVIYPSSLVIIKEISSETIKISKTTLSVGT